MEKIYITCFCAVTILLIIFRISINNKEGSLMSSLRVTLCISIFAFLVNIFSTLTLPIWACEILQGVYLASKDFLLISLVHFIFEYTGIWSNGNRKYRNITKKFVLCIALLDSISLISNVYFHHVFTIKKNTMLDGTTFYVFEGGTLPYNLHMIFLYCMIGFMIAMLLYKTKNAVGFYRKKYTSILALFVLAPILSAVYFYLVLPLDITLLLYALVVGLIYFFTVKYIPRTLLNSTILYMLSDMSMSIVIYDIRGHCIYSNDEMKKVIGLIDRLDKNRDIFSRKYIEENLGDRNQYYWEEIIESDAIETHYRVCYGKVYDNDGIYIGCYFFMNDITVEVEKIKEEHYKNNYDKLTGMLNMISFYEKVRNILNQDPESKYYMLCHDVKDFKLVNDLYGMATGDSVIRGIADIFKKNRIMYQVAGHITGDKFAALVKEEDYREKLVLEDLKSIEYLILNNPYGLHSQIGVYKITDPSIDVSIMFDRARTAIKLIKNNSQDYIAYYEKALMEQMLYEKTIISEFENMRNFEELVMFLQPQVSPEGKVLGAEALVRWDHPKKGLLMPGSFIEILEKANMIYMLDRHIWWLAARKLREWKDTEHNDLYISVNVSPKDFYYLDVYKEFTDLVEGFDINPAKLKIEITETALMSDLDRQMNLVVRLRQYGFEVEIDDFGRGYSSLGLLKDIEVDTLKLDMSFINSQSTVRGNLILSSVISLSRQLGMPVVSEGVESLSQVTHLANLGCNIFQGFYFAKPMPVNQFEKCFIKSGSTRYIAFS